jgi:hypothetical protein
MHRQNEELSRSSDSIRSDDSFGSSNSLASLADPNNLEAGSSAALPVFKPKKTKPKQSKAWNIAYLLPLSTAINDSTQIVMGLRASPLPITITAASAQFVTSFAMDASMTVKKLRQTYSKLSTRNSPITNNMYKAAAIATGVTLVVATSDGLQAYFFGESIPEEFNLSTPDWVAKTIGGVTASGASLTTLINGGIFSYEFILARFNGTQFPYSNSRRGRISYYLSPIISSTAGIISASNCMLTAAVGTATVLNIKPPYFYGFCAATLISGFSRFSVTSSFLKESINESIESVGKRKPHASEAFNFLFALSVACYLAYATQQLAMTLLDDAANILDIKPTDPVITAATAYSWVVAINDIITNTYCVRELATNVTHHLGKAYNAASGYCTGYQHLPEEATDAEANDNRILFDDDDQTDHSVDDRESTQSGLESLSDDLGASRAASPQIGTTPPVAASTTTNTQPTYSTARLFALKKAASWPSNLNHPSNDAPSTRSSF